ncbi:MAG: helix-turn-helix transcriptional regulator [Chloroflexi bacterium]|nr:helix-turn-helix transcriptional regulator [Chloroflexota bacterium]
MQVRRGYHRNAEVELTSRQRDVLRLIAQGKTNPEIAESLGIGYESVKSYVSEVLGKLGVDRREEAAAWWQAEQSLRRRLARFGAGVLVLVPRGARAVATGAALLLGGTLLAFMLVLSGRDDGTVLVATATETVAATSATPQPSVTQATAPAATATVAVVAPSVVAGKPVKVLVPGPPVAFPSDMVLYVAVSGCFSCGWPPGDLWRVYRGRDGRLVADHTKPEGNVPLYSISADGSLLIAGVCSSYCGAEADPDPAGVLQFLQSRDGGMSWQPIDGAAFSGTYAWFAGWYRGEAVVNATTRSPSDGGGPRYNSYLLPSFRKLDPPSGVPAATPGPYAMVGPDGALVWRQGNSAIDPRWLDSFAALGAVVPGVEWQSRTYGETSPGTSSGVWLATGLGNAAARFFVEVDGAGVPVAGYSAAVDAVTFAGRLSATSWLGTAVVPVEEDEPSAPLDSNVRAVLIDGTTGQLHPIAELRRDVTPLPGNFAWPRVALFGTFWRVSSGRDCLNVRKEPSTASPTLGCFRDGVLLRERTAAAPAGWRAVALPDGRPGFAAAEYLQ